MRVLISVSDKTGIVAFSQGLVALGFELISTGGTLQVLEKNGVPVRSIDSVTGFPEMLDGRVKTLHPKIHGGLLAVRDDAAHMATCQAHDIGMIDLVVVNLYPFEATIAKPGVSTEEAIENIDIGGPSMLRSASKNFRSVGVVVDPTKYEDVLDELKANRGQLSYETKAALAQEAFAHTARYDALIAGYFSDFVVKKSGEEVGLPATLSPVLRKISDLRYGENPHQKAAFYRVEGASGLPDMKQLHGKEISYNNVMDLEAAWRISRGFDRAGAVVIKHTNPCGAAVGASISEAYQKAYDADPVSAFGSIIGLNRKVDLATAEAISKTFVEAVIAPGFEPAALEMLSAKPSIRLMLLDNFQTFGSGLMYRDVSGGFLVQAGDDVSLSSADVTVVSKVQPTDLEMAELLFAFALVRHVKSNAIVVCRDGRTLGVGAGQMSRIDSVEIALKKSGSLAAGAVMASDAFFPFKDSVELAAAAGVKAIIQPGGSMRDQESIDACDAHGLVMVFTGTRHFLH